MTESPTAAARRPALGFAFGLNLLFVFVLVLIHLAQWRYGEFRAMALVPRESAGLIGIFGAPLLHGSWGHLGANAFSLLVLGTLSVLVYPRAIRPALVLIWLGAGVGTWLIGRDSFHIGASGLTHGLGFFLFTLGVLRRDRPALAAGMIAFLLFGGMLLTVLPREPGISWEYHLSGALAGLIAGWRWRALDPAPSRPRYSWEIEAEAVQPDATLEPPSPAVVPVLWQRMPEARGVVLPFRTSTPQRPPAPPEG